MKYYEEILEEIKKKMDNKEYEAALLQIKEELAMPYLPLDFEKTLNELKRDVQYQISEESSPKQISIDKILNMLKGNEKSQLRAVDLLADYNLRDYLPEIKDYLSKDPCEEASALLIELIAEQEIRDEFIMVRNGIEYTFSGDSVVPINESEGFLSALNFLQEWVENDYPVLFGMCRSLLIHKCYMELPLGYEKEEGYALATSVIDELADILEDDNSIQEIRKNIESLN